MKNKEHLVKCDECEFEFFLKAVGIKEATVELNGIPVTLVYFTCPKCNKIYRISIQDRRYYEMKEDLEGIKSRIRKHYGSHTTEFAKVLYSMVVKKQKRLADYVEKINKAFPGTFVFVTSENNHEEKSIKYLP